MCVIICFIAAFLFLITVNNLGAQLVMRQVQLHGVRPPTRPRPGASGCQRVTHHENDGPLARGFRSLFNGVTCSNMVALLSCWNVCWHVPDCIFEMLCFLSLNCRLSKALVILAEAISRRCWIAFLRMRCQLKLHCFDMFRDGTNTQKAYEHWKAKQYEKMLLFCSCQTTVSGHVHQGYPSFWWKETELPGLHSHPRPFRNATCRGLVAGVLVDNWHLNVWHVWIVRAKCTSRACHKFAFFYMSWIVLISFDQMNSNNFIQKRSHSHGFTKWYDSDGERERERSDGIGSPGVWLFLLWRCSTRFNPIQFTVSPHSRFTFGLLTRKQKKNSQAGWVWQFHGLRSRFGGRQEIFVIDMLWDDGGQIFNSSFTSQDMIQWYQHFFPHPISESYTNGIIKTESSNRRWAMICLQSLPIWKMTRRSSWCFFFFDRPRSTYCQSPSWLIYILFFIYICPLHFPTMKGLRCTPKIRQFKKWFWGGPTLPFHSAKKIVHFIYLFWLGPTLPFHSVFLFFWTGSNLAVL